MLYNESKRHFRSGSQKILHHWICSALKKDKASVNESSLVSSIKCTITKLQHLKKYTKDNKSASKFENVATFKRAAKRLKYMYRENVFWPFTNNIRFLNYTVENLNKKLHVKNIKIRSYTWKISILLKWTRLINGKSKQFWIYDQNWKLKQ